MTSDRYVTADRQRLQQVLLNLLSNAVKYNRDHGEVAVSCEERPEGRVRLTISDTGAGIAPEMLDRLFTPFDRLGAEQAEIDGTGLGLALSKHLVEAMGGLIQVESGHGGTVFTIELEASEGLSGAVLSTDTGIDAQTPRAQGTVLYIEDNVANLRLLERIIRRCPAITLLSAMQGSQGVELAQASRRRPHARDPGCDPQRRRDTGTGHAAARARSPGLPHQAARRERAPVAAR